MSLDASRRPWSRAPHSASVLPAFSPLLLSSFSSLFLSFSSLSFLCLLLFPGPFAIETLPAQFFAVMLQVTVANHHILVPGLGGVCAGMLARTPHAQSDRYSHPTETMLLQLTVINPTMVKLRPRNENAPVDHYKLIPWSHLNKRRNVVCKDGYMLCLFRCIELNAKAYMHQG